MKQLNNYLKELNKLNGLKDAETPHGKLKKLLQLDNIKIALYNDVIDAVVETWNKYSGKQLGERTAEKIKMELEQIFDNKIFAYIRNNYIYITTRDASGKYKGDAEIEIKTNHYEKKMTENNKILTLNVEDLHETDNNNYTENLEETATQILELHKQAEQLQDQLNAVYKKINKLSNHKQQAVQYTSSVRHWII